MANRTPFYPRRSLAIEQNYDRLERELFSPWAFFNCGKSLIVTPCEGKPQRIGDCGLEFSGTPREIFWRFFDPDIGKIIIEQIEQTVKDCEAIPDLLEQASAESRELMADFVEKAYNRLAEIDRGLVGRSSFPQSVGRHRAKIQTMVAFLNNHIDAAIAEAGLKRWGSVLLETRQKNLLMTLAEAESNVPNGKGQEFFLGADLRRGGHYIGHPGLGRKHPVVLGDVKALEREGFIQFSREGIFDITPRGSAYYRYLKRQSGKAVERVEAELRHYLDSARFRNTYPDAYNKWSEAERLLWEPDSEKHFTTIGHLCREAMQEFADQLIKSVNIPDESKSKADTTARIKSVLAVYSQQLGSKEKDLLNTLISYWSTVYDLTQRQEHGLQRKGSPLIWEDARRVVFQTAVVMFEIDTAISRPSQP